MYQVLLVLELLQVLLPLAELLELLLIDRLGDLTIPAALLLHAVFVEKGLQESLLLGDKRGLSRLIGHQGWGGLALYLKSFSCWVK
jgi:hypothetical protein